MVASDLNVSVGCLKFTYSSLFPTKQVDRLLFLKFLKRNEHTPKSSYLLFFFTKANYKFQVRRRPNTQMKWGYYNESRKEGKRKNSACNLLAISDISWSSLTSIPSRSDPTDLSAKIIFNLLNALRTFRFSGEAFCSERFHYYFSLSFVCFSALFPWRKTFPPQRATASGGGDGKHRV